MMKTCFCVFLKNQYIETINDKNNQRNIICIPTNRII